MQNIQKENPLLCDPVTGVCEIPQPHSVSESNVKATKKPLRLVYFTDPICSSCWGIEPQLRKLKLEYGASFEIDYRMGGLLKSWDSYGGSDVSNPEDVAKHWDEVSDYYDMPIDGNLWLEDPLPSSFPPSIAFKAAQIQSEEKALKFLRRIKEMVFLEKKNIARWEILEQAAIVTELDIEKLKADIHGQAKLDFEEDLKLAASLGVRGFPTIFFTDEEDNRLKLTGVKPYRQFEETLLKLFPSAEKKPIELSGAKVFDYYPTLTLKEFYTLTEITKQEAEKKLSKLVEEGKVQEFGTRNGSLFKIK